MKKLSQLIREGAPLRPQKRCSYFQVEEDGTVTHACAMGSALEAAAHDCGHLGMPYQDMSISAMMRDLIAMIGYDPAHREMPSHQDTEDMRSYRIGQGPDGLSILHAVVYLNDRRGWNREDIATYLEKNDL